MREGEQDDGGVGGLGVHLSTQIHQEYAFRRRSACRTPAQSQQEYLTSGKEYIEPCKTRQDEETRGKNQSVSRGKIVLVGLAIGNPVKLLSFSFFSSVTFFIIINLCFCIGLLQFCGVFLFFFFFLIFLCLFLFLIF